MITDKQMATLRAMRVDETAREMMRDGIVLTREQCDELGEVRLQWISDRLGLARSDDGLSYLPRAAAKKFALTVLNAEDLVISVKISEECVPHTIDSAGDEVPDYGNADWPSDIEVSEEASKVLGRTVQVKFCDAGDTLLEGIYKAQ